MTTKKHFCACLCLVIITAVAIAINSIEGEDNETNTQRDEGRIETGEVRGEREENSGHGVESWGQVPHTATDRIKPTCPLGEGEAQRVPIVPFSNEREDGVLQDRFLPFMEQRERNLQARIPC